MGTATDRPLPVSNETSVGLPPLSGSRRSVWDYYRIHFLDDGYPARMTDRGPSPHPIYGTYVITDYLASFKRTGDEEYLRAARRVAAAAVTRMSEISDALAFMYEPDQGISSLPGRFYSGLTQARYLKVLGDLHQIDPAEQHMEAAQAILRSLLIPASNGGVTRPTPRGGLLIEEYPHDVPDYTLNGWMTATLAVKSFADATGDDDALSLFEASAAGVIDVLSLYDVGELANSRYRLGGKARIKLTFSLEGCSIGDGALRIPKHGSFSLPIRTAEDREGVGRYIRGVERTGGVSGRVALLEVYLSRASWPAPNTLALPVVAPGEGRVTVQVGQGDYHPLTRQLRASVYETLEKLPLTEGQNDVRIRVPWSAAELIAYPTNFAKRLDGKNYNVYHYMHIDLLTKLSREVRSDVVDYFRDRWRQYPSRWPLMAEYAGHDLEFQRHGQAHADGGDN